MSTPPTLLMGYRTLYLTCHQRDAVTGHMSHCPAYVDTGIDADQMINEDLSAMKLLCIDRLQTVIQSIACPQFAVLRQPSTWLSVLLDVTSSTH